MMKEYTVPVNINAISLKKVVANSYEEAVDKLESEVNGFTIDQTKISLPTLDGQTHNFETEDIDIEYDRNFVDEFEKSDQMI
jgi:hypothetical protein